MLALPSTQTVKNHLYPDMLRNLVGHQLLGGEEKYADRKLTLREDNVLQIEFSQAQYLFLFSLSFPLVLQDTAMEVTDRDE
ncbi:hypothetical protein RRG08_062227 [Elysia crispata]|uniref:Uncharacterized protein n=1 Tax=Elysia crispata TaxID=231223 RepID=A0AAE1CUX2_9GAST|nr:hypothetical protein RRG08_062227 [Elysia crispata]